MDFFFKGLKLGIVKAKRIKDSSVRVSTDKTYGFFFKEIGDWVSGIEACLTPMGKVGGDVFERQGGCWMSHG